MTIRRARWPVAIVGVAAVAVAVVITVLVTNGGSGTAVGPRALTSDEANELAVTRFLNYQAGGRAVTITVPGTAGGLVITASVDYRASLGYGVVHGAGRDASSDGLIEWTAHTVLVDPMTNAPADPPAAPPTTGWFSRPLQTAGSSLDSSLAIALSLAADRPDNAELLAQNGATWTGQDQVDGHPVDVMTGPNVGAGSATVPTVRYWLGSDGTMYRVQAGLASESQPMVVDFDTHRYVRVPAVPGLTPAG
jgi:hypothetical protein